MKNKIIRLLLIFTFAHFHICTSAQNVGIGTTAPVGKLHIKGSADTTQLIIDANSTQSNTKPLIKLRNSSGTDLMGIHSDDPYNTFVGLNAGRVNNAAMGGGRNTFIGSGSGYSNTSGYFNTANGYGALYYNTSGFFNTASGTQALYYNTLGGSNTANGYGALYSNTTASQNTAIGANALSNQSYNPGSAWISGNTAVGFAALKYNNPTSTSNGVNNTALGHSSLFNNVIGNQNTAVGYNAGRENTYGSNNAFFGSEAGYNNTNAGNTAIGRSAMYSNTVGLYNTAVGFESLYSNINGGYNTSLGYASAVDLPNNSNNTIIGAAAHVYGNNNVVLGFNAYTNASNAALLGSTTTVYCGGYANWSNFSDGRFKTGVEENVKGLDFILRLRPVTYHMDVRGIYNLWGISPYGKEDENISMNASMKAENKQQMDEAITNKEAIRMSGFIAQEVEKAAVKSGYDFDGVIKPAHDKDHYRLAYGEFVVPLVKAVQEQQVMIEQLKQMVLQQQKEIEKLKKKKE